MITAGGGFAPGTAGFFLDIARQPPPPGLPTLRAFQRFQADALLPWSRYQVGPPAHRAEPARPAH
jgi:hypothetical protein